MTISRIQDPNRLHIAASNPDGLDEVKRLVEEEKVDVNELTEKGIPPIAFAAREGSVDIVKYLLEHKAQIEQPPGKPNLLIAYANSNNIDKEELTFFADLHKDFHDTITELHLAVAYQDHDKINDIVAKDPNSVFAKDNEMNGLTPIYYATVFQYFEIAGFLLTHTDPNHADYNNNLNRFLEGFSNFTYFNQITNDEKGEKDEKEEKQSILLSFLLKIAKEIQPIQTPQYQLSYYITLLLIEYLNLAENEDEKKRLITAIQNIIFTSTKKDEFPKECGWICYSLAVDLSDENPFKKNLFEIAFQSIPDTDIDIAPLFFNYARNMIAMNQGIQSVQIISNRLLNILDTPIKNDLNKVPYEENDPWVENVIKPLMKDPSPAACKAVIIFLQLFLQITSLEKTDSQESVSDIAKLYFTQLHHYLEMGHCEEAYHFFQKCDLRVGMFLADDAMLALIKVTMAFVKNNIFDAISKAAELVTYTRLIEYFRSFILAENLWKETLYLLKALHEKNLLNLFPPDALIDNTPFIIQVVTSSQYDILKFLFEKTDIMSEEMLTASISIEKDETKNCTALYIAGVKGDLFTFDYLFGKIPTFYHPIYTDQTKPIIHAILENASFNFSKLGAYYKILQKIVFKYPDEINRIWKTATVDSVLENMSDQLKKFFTPALRYKEFILQKEFELQIERIIIQSQTVSQIMSGKIALGGVCFFESSPQEAPLDLAIMLHEKIEILDSLITPYEGIGWLQVSESFYNFTFLAWKLKIDTERGCYNDENLPTVTTQDTLQIIKEINTVLILIHEYFKRSVKSAILKNDKVDLICHCDSEILAEEKQSNKALPLNTAPTTSSSFSSLFKKQKPISESSLQARNKKVKLDTTTDLVL